MYTCLEVCYATRAVAPDDDRECLSDMVNSILDHWREDDDAGSQCYIVRDGAGKVVATLMSGNTPDVALVLYAEGALDKFTVEYVLDDEGHYVRTSITPIA